MTVLRLRQVNKSVGMGYGEPCAYDCGAVIEPAIDSGKWSQCPNCGQFNFIVDSDSDFVEFHSLTTDGALKHYNESPPDNAPMAELVTMMPDDTLKEYNVIKAAGGANWQAKANQLIKGLLKRGKGGKFARAAVVAASATQQELGGGDFSAGADKTVNFEFGGVPTVEYFKAANVHAKAGETIAGNLVRGSDGKFSSGGGSSSPKKKGTKPSDVAKKKRQELIDKKAHDKDAAKYNEAELAKRDQARADKRASQDENNQEASQAGKDAARTNRGEISDNLLGDDSEAINAMFDNEDGINAENGDNNDQISPEYQQHLIDKGLAEKDANGKLQLSKAGKAYKKAAESGDSERAKATLDKAAKQKATRDKVATKKAAKGGKAPKGKKAKGGGNPLGLSAGQRQKLGSKEVSTAPLTPGGFMVFKSAGGVYRWLAISGNSFRDRDKEIISQAALLADVERADLDQDYGPLLWWHIPELVIGHCDFNMMIGRQLIESGTFISKEIAEICAANTKTLGLSLGFKTFMHMPINGVYDFIRRKERSILPATRASNIFTKLFVKENKNMEVKDKIKNLVDLLARSNGGDKLAALAAISDISDNAAEVEKAALDAGIVTKEAGGKIVLKAAPEGSPEEEAAESPEEEAQENDEVIDLTVDDLKTMITQIITGALTEFASQLQGAMQGQAVTAKETTASAVKEAIKEMLAPISQEVKDVKQKTKELAGETPRYFQNARAITDPSNVINKESAPPAPDKDSFDDMYSTLFGGGQK